MIYYTDPLFALPMTFSSSVSIRVVLSSPAASVTASITAGTYYWTGDTTQPEDLLGALATALTAQEVTDGTGGTWTGAYDAGPLAGAALQPSLTREAGAGTDTVTSLVFPSSALPGDYAGFAGNTVAAPAHSAGDDVTFQAQVARFTWGPMRPPRRGYTTPRRGVGVSSSRAGRASVLVTDPVDATPLLFEHVRGCLVLVDLLERAPGVISGLTALDVYATLEKFWVDHGERAPIRYYPDRTDATNYLERQIIDPVWLSDPVGGGSWELGEESLDYWRVDMPLEAYTQ